jgi:hypothetical protein
MAIYNNREVYIIGPTAMSTTPEQLTVRYRDGSQENVPTSNIRFTEDEKKNLIKIYPSKFDGVSTVSEDDITAVRVGVAPAYDPDYKVQAETQARAKLQQEETAKRTDKARKEADERLNKELKADPKAVPVTASNPNTGIYTKTAAPVKGK